MDLRTVREAIVEVDWGNVKELVVEVHSEDDLTMSGAEQGRCSTLPAGRHQS